MSKTIVHSGQSFFNKVVELTGDIDNSFEMMLLNSKTSLTSNVSVAEELKASTVTDNEVVEFYLDKMPATLFNRKSQVTTDFGFPGEFPFSF